MWINLSSLSQFRRRGCAERHAFLNKSLPSVASGAVQADPCHAALGFSGLRPDNGGMDTDTEKQRGFVFPGVFEITAMGSASAQLETAIPHELERAGLTVLHETVSSRASSAGRFVSVSLSFKANTRAEYEAAHEALRAHPEIKWTL